MENQPCLKNSRRRPNGFVLTFFFVVFLWGTLACVAMFTVPSFTNSGGPFVIFAQDPSCNCQEGGADYNCECEDCECEFDREPDDEGWTTGIVNSDGSLFGRDLAGIILTYIAPFVVMMSVVWAIWVGIQFARAGDENSRKMAKKRFMSAVSSMLIFVVLYGIMAGLVLAFNPPPNINVDMRPPQGPHGPNPPVVLPPNWAPPTWTPPGGGGGSGATDFPRVARNLGNPVYLSGLRGLPRNLAVNNVLLSPPYGGNVLVAEEMTSLYGSRRIFTHHDLRHHGTDPRNVRALLDGRLPGNFHVGMGFNEDFYGIDIDTHQGEGLAIPIPIPSQFIIPSRSPIPGYVPQMSVTGFTVDIQSFNFDRPNFMRFMGNTLPSAMPYWRAPYLYFPTPGELPDISPDAFLPPWAEARASRAGVIVAAGNTETDCPHESAWIIIRHNTPLPGHERSYSFYGNLFGAIRVPDHLLNAYYSNPDRYFITPAVVGPPPLPPAMVALPGFGAGYFSLNGARFSSQHFNRLDLISTPDDPSPLPVPTRQLVSERGIGGGILGPHMNFFTARQFAPDIDVENLWLDMSGNPIDWENIDDDFDWQNGIDWEHAGVDVVYDVHGNPTFDFENFTLPPFIPHWIPTSVLNRGFMADYNPNLARLGRRGYFDQDIIGTTVAQGQFLGYIGGGLLDPGGGNHRQSYIDLSMFRRTTVPLPIPELDDVLSFFVDLADISQGVMDELFDGVLGDIIDMGNLFDRIPGMEDILNLASDALPGVDDIVPDWLTDMIPGLGNVPVVGDWLDSIGRADFGFDASDVVKGVNTTSQRRLEYRIYSNAHGVRGMPSLPDIPWVAPPTLPGIPGLPAPHLRPSLIHPGGCHRSLIESDYNKILDMIHIPRPPGIWGSVTNLFPGLTGDTQHPFCRGGNFVGTTINPRMFFRTISIPRLDSGGWPSVGDIMNMIPTQEAVQIQARIAATNRTFEGQFHPPLTHCLCSFS